MKKLLLRYPRLTLGQWLVSVALIVLLAALTISIFKTTERHVHREYARNALTSAAQWMERTATTQGRYPEQGAIPPGALSVKGGRYLISAVSRNGVEYTLTATPTGAQSHDPCGIYRINQEGTRLQMASSEVPYPMGPLECWKR